MIKAFRQATSVISIAATMCAGAAQAADKIRIAGSQRGFWDTTIFTYAEKEKGFFKQAGLELEILWTNGGADCENPVINGSLDVCLATGTLGALTAWSKGAPIAIIAAEATGARDVWWYAKADSGIKSIKDTDGKTVTFSRPGSSSNLLINAIVAAAGVNAKIIGSGGPSATLTQVMSGQIDVGWTAGILGADLLRQGKIVRVVSGEDAPGVATQSVRVHIANTNFLKANTDAVKRFLAAYKKSIDWAYSDPKAVQMWAEDNKSTVEVARSVIDEMYPKSALAMQPVGNMELTVQQAIESKRMQKPLTPEQTKDLLHYVADLNQ